MAAVTQSLRVQGVALPDVTDWTAPLPAGKWSQFFKALAERTTLVGVTRPSVSHLEQAVTLARAFHRDRAQWLGRYGFSLDRVARLDRKLQAELAARRDRFDLIVQLQTLCSPRSVGAPYVIYTDNTFALTRRIYPAYATMPVRNSERWQRFEADVCRGAEYVFTFSEFARASVLDNSAAPPTGCSRSALVPTRSRTRSTARTTRDIARCSSAARSSTRGARFCCGRGAGCASGCPMPSCASWGPGGILRRGSGTG